MTAMTDRELLQQYAETGSQEAFAELVSHHSDWIYSAALRLVRRRDYAEDVTQAVFLVLAQRAKKLDVSTLNGWLFKVTRYCASNILREENRREKRERRAAIMNSQIREVVAESTWDEIAPVLEQTVGRLRAADRKAVLLRFYQQKSLSEVGDALGISEEAARKRVAKALAKLWSLLSVHRVMLPAAGVAVTLLSERGAWGFLSARRGNSNGGAYRTRSQSDVICVEIEDRGFGDFSDVADPRGDLDQPAHFNSRSTRRAGRSSFIAGPARPDRRGGGR
jgi:RNA polymerase sigma factor (sigma-70 family)